MTIRPVTEEEVRELSTWRNDPPRDVDEIGLAIRSARDAQYRYGPRAFVESVALYPGCVSKRGSVACETVRLGWCHPCSH